MADKKIKETVKNSRSFNKLEDANFGSGDMYRPNYETPLNNIPMEMPPPAIPPRQSQIMDYPFSYCNPYNPYSSYNNNSYYNNFYPRNSYTYNNNFTQQAEATTRRAFESVESVVQTLNSVAMMLDSSYQAVYNCFRALLGVSNNMSHLRSHMHNILKSASLIPFVRYALKNMRYLLLLLMKGRQVANEDFLWNESSLQTEASNSRPWPIIMFFTVIAVGPWLLWKLMSVFNMQENTAWIKNSKLQYVAKARFAFEARQSDEMSFKRNDTVVIAPKEMQKNKPKGWLLASDGVNKVGLVPINHLVFGKTPPSFYPDKKFDKELKNSQSSTQQDSKVQFQAVESETMLNEKIDDFEKVFEKT